VVVQPSLERVPEHVLDLRAEVRDAVVWRLVHEPEHDPRELFDEPAVMLCVDPGALLPPASRRDVDREADPHRSSPVPRRNDVRSVAQPPRCAVRQPDPELLVEHLAVADGSLAALDDAVAVVGVDDLEQPR
jgi:hypothetical protein